MINYFRGFVKYIPLLNELVARDIKTKYRRSILGLLWALLNPLLMMMILTLVFSTLFKSNIEHFPVYLLCGQVIFNYFSEATNGAMYAIILNSALIRKVYVPKYLFVFSKPLSSLVNLIASFAALLIVMAVTGVAIKPMIILSVIPLAGLLMFATGVGLILATISVFFRDMLHFYTVFLTGLVYLTPMFYPLEILPETIKKIVTLNPLTNIIVYLRYLTLYEVIPDYSLFLKTVVPGGVILIAGLIVFYRMQDKFVLHI